MPQPDGERPSSAPPLSADTELSPIGVPPGYAIERDSPFQGTADHPQAPHRETITPVYYEGDDWNPASFPPQTIVELQKAMIDAGLLDPEDKVHLGVWDETTRQAYRKLLAYANASGLGTPGRVPVAALNRWKQTGDQFGTSDGYTPPPLQVKLSNPDDLKQVFRKAVIDQLGEAWDESKLDAMVASYQDKERETQTAAYNLETANEGMGAAGTVIPPPDPTTFATTQIESEDPTGVQAKRGLGFQNEFFQMLRGVV